MSQNRIEEFISEVFGEVRANNEDGILIFVASDVAKVLKYSTTQKVTDKVDDEDKGYRTWLTLGGEQKLAVINESGLYQVIASITKKDIDRYSLSRDFKRWITGEVIPTLRQTGAYIEEDREEEMIDKYFPNMSEETKLMMYKDVRKANKRLQVKADKWDKFIDKDSTYSFTEASKLISTMGKEEQSDVKISGVKLTAYLRDKGILSKAKTKKGYKNLPNKEFEDKFNVVSVNTGNFETTQTRVKPSGVEYIYELLKAEV